MVPMALAVKIAGSNAANMAPAVFRIDGSSQLPFNSARANKIDSENAEPSC